jgi:hypothetical protein
MALLVIYQPQGFYNINSADSWQQTAEVQSYSETKNEQAKHLKLAHLLRYLCLAKF